MKFRSLESNPDSINKYLDRIGLSNNYGLHDIIGFSTELLPFIIQPVYAIIFLYPYKGDKLDAYFTCLNENEEERKLKDEELGKDLYKIKQIKELGHACGTIALIHAIANNIESLEFKEDSVLKKFIDSTLDKTPDERGAILEKNDEMVSAHKECAENGETEMNDGDSHFVALIEHKGYVWRLDGSKSIRVNVTTKEIFLESVAEYVNKFVEMNPDLIAYSAMTLSQL